MRKRVKVIIVVLLVLAIIAGSGFIAYDYMLSQGELELEVNYSGTPAYKDDMIYVTCHLTNTGDTPVRVVDANWPVIEIYDSDGNTYQSNRSDFQYQATSPLVILQPGDFLAARYGFKPYDYGVPKTGSDKLDPDTYYLKATYKSEERDDIGPGYWVGTVKSEPVEVPLYG